MVSLKIKVHALATLSDVVSVMKICKVEDTIEHYYLVTASQTL